MIVCDDDMLVVTAGKGAPPTDLWIVHTSESNIPVTGVAHSFPICEH